MNNYTTIDPSSLDNRAIHKHLLTAVAPRPICFASTIDKKGNVNLSPFSFFNVFSSNPPIMIFSPSRRGSDNTTKHSYENVLEVGEVVINIVNYAIVHQMSLTSTEYNKGVNEFVKAGLTQVKSEKVLPPRVGEAPVSFECKVQQVIPLGDSAGAGNLIIAKIILMHFQNQYLNDSGQLDTEKLDLVARMGESWYCRASKEALFEIPKPFAKEGIGVDQLPKSIQLSEVLTGNDLAQLGNIETLPKSEAIKEVLKLPEVSSLFSNKKNLVQQRKSIHQLAKSFILTGAVETALKILLLLEKIEKEKTNL